MRKFILAIVLAFTSATAADIAYLPFRVVEPIYPLEARLEKIEGYVVVQVDVTGEGFTSNIKVIESEPPDVFDQAAINAAKKLLYRPRYVNSKPVTVPSVLYKYEFNLQ